MKYSVITLQYHTHPDVVEDEDAAAAEENDTEGGAHEGGLTEEEGYPFAGHEAHGGVGTSCRLESGRWFVVVHQAEELLFPPVSPLVLAANARRLLEDNTNVKCASR